MARWVMKKKDTDSVFEEFNTLIDAEIALGGYEARDKELGLYTPDFYRIEYDGVKYTDLSTTAKITCMSEFLNKLVPYDWDDINEDDIAALEDTILYWVGTQYWFDEDGFWYDESMGRL